MASRKENEKDIKLYNGTSKSNGYWYFSEPKYNSYRQIDLDDELIALLKEKKNGSLNQRNIMLNIIRDIIVIKSYMF